MAFANIAYYCRNATTAKAVLVGGFFGLLAPWAANAQTAGGVSPEEVLRLPQQVRASLPSFGDQQCAVASVRDAGEGETPSLRLTGIETTQTLAVPLGALEREWAPLIGADLSREALQRLVTRIECAYRAKGFVMARAELAETQQSGTFALTVNEGQVERVEAATADDSSASFLLRAFADVKEGQPLNARDVRAGLARAAQFGFANVRPTIRRSRTNPNGLDLVVIAETPKDDAFLSVQNSNTDIVGPWGAVAGVRVRGLTPLYEQTTFGYYRSLDVREQRAVQLNSEAMVTNSGATVRVDWAYSLAKPGADLKPLEIKAETQFAKLELNQPLIVRRGLIASASAGFEFLDQTTSLFSDVRLSEDRLRIASLGGRVDGLTGPVAWSTDLSVRKGIAGLGAARRSDDDLSRFGGDPQAWVVRAETQASIAPMRYLALSAKLRGQWTDDNLLAFEEFNFGALTGGRGFNPGAITGDSGIALNLEASTPAIRLPADFALQPVAFVDTARAWKLSNPTSKYSDGASGGVGVRAQWRKRAQLEVMWANPLGNIVGADRSALGPKVQVMLSTSMNWSLRDGFKWGGAK